MSILFSPSAVIFANTDIVQQIQDVLTRQLYLNEIIDAATFDARVAADPDYTKQVHQDGERILVLRDLWDLTNRESADIVLFVKAGLISVLSNKFGPPRITLPIDKVYLTALINLQVVPREPSNTDSFNPNIMDPPNVEPV